jgi:hypothetical protein
MSAQHDPYRHAPTARTVSAGLGAGLAACLAAAALGCGAAHPRATGAARPPVWRSARIATGAVLYYPPGWRLAAGDAGTATAVLPGAGHRIAGYLNLTPRQGGETLSGWAAFRLAHNAREERAVRREALGPGVRLPHSRGRCVRDSYTTSTGARYVELACLIPGRAESVVVAASPPADWTRLAPVLERAVADVRT